MTSVDAPRSTFITVLGWAFVGIGAIGALFSVVIAMITTAGLRMAEQGDAMGAPYRAIQQAMQSMPPPLPWIYDHQAPLMLAGGAWLLVHLVVAIGLLQRRNGARLAFIALMLLDIVLQVVSAPYVRELQVATQQAMRTQMPGAPALFTAWMDHILAIQRAESIMRPIVLILFFGWTAWRLRSATIRREFVREAIPEHRLTGVH